MKPIIKFCGMKSESDFKKAVESDAEMIGFIFAPSKRQVSAKQVKTWINNTPAKKQQQLVGVFVNEPVKKVIEVANDVALDIVQCHGTETIQELKTIKTNTKSLVYKTIHHQENALAKMKRYEGIADGFVIDTKTVEAWGGTGTQFDWTSIPSYTREANRQRVTCLIAGGVNIENILELLDYQPLGIDISSGIETNGMKDERKMTKMTKAGKAVYQQPDQLGRFGPFGGKYVPETLMFALEELEDAYKSIQNDESFAKELQKEMKEYSGRPTALTHAERLSAHYGGATIFLKREDLNHTGAHKINNALAQGLLAKRMGKSQIVAETGAGQHGVASATVAARFGLSCKVFMGAEDIKRQELNVFRMRLLGAEVIEVHSGGKTLKDATNEAIRHWVAHVDDTFYLIGSVVGPHPYPMMVRNFQSVIGEESKVQMKERIGHQPNEVVACVGGGSNSMGIFYPYINNSEVSLTGIEAAGKGTETTEHAATLTKGRKGVLHGSLSYLLQDENGNIIEPYSISAGLDYPGIGPEHAHLRDIGRVQYEAITDVEAMEALEDLCKLEGILPAIETAHALAYVRKKAPEMPKDYVFLVCLSGRGDKDVHTIQQVLGADES